MLGAKHNRAWLCLFCCFFFLPVQIYAEPSDFRHNFQDRIQNTPSWRNEPRYSVTTGEKTTREKLKQLNQHPKKVKSISNNKRTPKPVEKNKTDKQSAEKSNLIKFQPLPFVKEAPSISLRKIRKTKNEKGSKSSKGYSKAGYRKKFDSILSDSSSFDSFLDDSDDIDDDLSSDSSGSGESSGGSSHNNGSDSGGSGARTQDPGNGDEPPPGKIHKPPPDPRDQEPDGPIRRTSDDKDPEPPPPKSPPFNNLPPRDLGDLKQGELRLTNVRKYGNHDWGSPTYTDIMNHSKEKSHYGHGPGTDSHENLHGIDADLSNAKPIWRYKGNTGYNRNEGLYILNGKAIYIKEPENTTLLSVASYVPMGLRGFRFKLYLLDQNRYFKDEPLYILEEANAYIMGAKTNVETVKAGKWNFSHREDAVRGALEFSAYSLALGLAIQHQDPDYFRENYQFRESLKFFVEEAMEVYNEGKDLDQFQGWGMEEYHRYLKEGHDARHLREFARMTYGDEWAEEHLGLEPKPDKSSSSSENKD